VSIRFGSWRRFLLATAVGATAGCGSSPRPAGEAVAVAAPEPPAAPAAAQPAAPAPAPKPADPPAGFAFPTDAAGRALPRVVTPAPPDPPPTERFAEAPQPRTLPTKIASPEPIGRTVYALPPVLPARPAGLKPAAPAERVPVVLGVGADAVPVRPTLPESPGVTARAPDVSRPPPLPVLGRRLSDRASLDDPTAEAANAAIAARPAGLPWNLSAFVRPVVPDPFELAGQVKPTVPPAAEPGLSPVPVSPRRVK